MPDSTLTIDYSITSVTNNADGTTTLAYTLSFDNPVVTQNRTDKFRTSELAAGINTSTDDGLTKLEQLKENFVNLANAYLKEFAKKVRQEQEKQDALLIDDALGEVSGLSTTLNISGSVTVSV